MKKFLAILALCTMPLIVDSCATNPTDPTDSTGDTTATKQTIDSACRTVIPGTIIEIREITDEDGNCTCTHVEEGDGEHEYEHSHESDKRKSYKHHHNRGKHHGHHKHKHKHKHSHDHDDDDDDDDDSDDDDDNSTHTHTKTPTDRRWVVTILSQCGDTVNVVFTRNLNMVEITGDSTFCGNKILRPNDSCITLDSAQTTVTTQKKGSEVEKWEAEKNPTTKEWKYYFTVKYNDKKYFVAVDAKTGQITEDKEI